jgi:hypothetical protein
MMILDYYCITGPSFAIFLFLKMTEPAITAIDVSNAASPKPKPSGTLPV